MDVEFPYINVPHKDGLQAIRNTVHTDAIAQLLSFEILSSQLFQIWDTLDLQMSLHGPTEFQHIFMVGLEHCFSYDPMPILYSDIFII